MQNLPILWSFRRCPYAIRARLAVVSAGRRVELREILLRDKPEAFLAISASATVPALQMQNGVLDESLDIMLWALRGQDPENLGDMPQEGWRLIAENDGPFKAALDRTKYAVRYPGSDPVAAREKASRFIHTLEARLAQHAHLTGSKPSLADIAIVPFVRQFAHIDRDWFDAQPWPHVIDWLNAFLRSRRFSAVMAKFPVWEPEAPLVVFPTETAATGAFGGERRSAH